MDLATFKESLNDEAPPEAGLALRALWHDARGDWKRAHDLAQQADNQAGAWVHAYLHRKEGDRANAGYWYRRAGRPMAEGPLENEWENIAESLIRNA